MPEKPKSNNNNAAAKAVEKNASAGRTSMVATDDRRRSQRVMMRVGGCGAIFAGRQRGQSASSHGCGEYSRRYDLRRAKHSR